MSLDTERASMIAKLNDKIRKSELYTMITDGIRDDIHDHIGLLKAVENYDTFTDDNDPWSEHDFGSLIWEGRKVFWKIDYYDQQMKCGLDPLDPKCRRVLTIMLAEEY